MSKRNKIIMGIVVAMLFSSVVFNFKMFTKMNKAYEGVDYAMCSELRQIKTEVLEADKILAEKKSVTAEDLQKIGGMLYDNCHINCKDIQSYRTMVGGTYREVDLFNLDCAFTELRDVNDSISGKDVQKINAKLQYVIKLFKETKLPNRYDYRKDPYNLIADLEKIDNAGSDLSDAIFNSLEEK